MRTAVLIAGAGPTGLTLAIELARRDIPVRVIDRNPAFPAGSRGDGIQPRTLEVFDDLGVLDAVLADGAPGPVLRAYIGGQFAGEHRMAEPVAPTPAIPHPNAWFLGQDRTEAILRARLAEFGIEVETGTALTGCTRDATGVTAVLEHGTARADYLVGADGGRSTVRRALGIPFDGSTDETFRLLLGDARADALDHTCGHWFAADPEHPMDGIALTPLPGGRHFQIVAPLGADAEPGLTALQAVLDRHRGGIEAELTELDWVTVWRPNIRLARHFRAGRVFLAGDAAHTHPPTGGQGMNTGIQDAYNLGWKLAAALDGDETPLGTYEPERRAVAARVLGLSTELMADLRDGREGALERGENTRQLDISYRTPDDPAFLAVGDRAPDAPVLTADGRASRLFDLFRGPHATLLCFGASGTLPRVPGARVYAVLRPGVPAAGAHVRDAEGHAYAGYGATDGERILIRPDGYVGSVHRTAGAASRP
ncbi:FAD-dependent monooxygenase [Nocardia asteroides]|uniref:FAD-dependent monooxygenase n=1 Tax=Nocardia asteroides TaxID=1824 RepID=UPI001E5A2A0E|nr:FAD-dependent monooxygenase [Nocardia asteroides]UGT61042.1 FAD-dependent monooxygenase [Nocardia asteroides]